MVRSTLPWPGNTLDVLLGNGNGTFQTPLSQSIVGLRGANIVAADFNHDGKLDLAIGYSTNSLEVGTQILLGNGNGTFQNPIDYPDAGIAEAAGDFNGDGKTDLALQSGDTVEILIGNGDGTFAARAAYAGTGQGSVSFVVAADFNDDGNVDLAIANVHNEISNDLTPDYVNILLGNGDGTFQGTPLASLPGQIPCNFVESEVVGDFNGDGNSDLAVNYTNFYGEPGGLAVLLGNGNGTFQAHCSSLA